MDRTQEKSLHVRLNHGLDQQWTGLTDLFAAADDGGEHGRLIRRVGELLTFADTEVLIDAMKMDPKIAEAVASMASAGYHEAWKRSMERKDPALA